MATLNWKRMLVVGFFSLVWLETVVVALKAWPGHSMTDVGLLYLPTILSPAAAVFVASIAVGFWYATMTYNNLFLVVVIWGMLGFWSTVGLHTDGLFPTLTGDPLRVFAALYAAAYMTRLSTLSARPIIGE